MYIYICFFDLVYVITIFRLLIHSNKKVLSAHRSNIFDFLAIKNLLTPVAESSVRSSRKESSNEKMSQLIPVKASLRLQLIKKMDYQFFLDFVNHSGNFAVKKAQFKEYVFSGSNWEVSLRDSSEKPSNELGTPLPQSGTLRNEWLLWIKSGTIVSLGVVRHRFNASCFIPAHLVESFFRGLKEFIHDFNQFVLEEASKREEMILINNELQLIAQTSSNSSYEEHHVESRQCMKMSLNEREERDMEGGILANFDVNALDFLFSLVKRQSMSETNEITYWVTALCDPWNDPDELMVKLKKSLKELGINAYVYVVEKGEDVKCKRDLKFRLLSKDSYDAVLEHAEELFIGENENHSQIRKVEHQDFYFDTLQKYLLSFRSSIRLRKINDGNELPKYKINFQEDISVALGQQNRDFQTFSIADPAVAEHILRSKKLDLDALGEDGRVLKDKIFCHSPRTIPLDLTAKFRTTRTIIPWNTFPLFLNSLHGASGNGEQKSLTVNIDHTQYEVQLKESGLREISIYELEVTNINDFYVEVSPLEVKKALVEVLQLADVEFLASVINKRKEHDFLVEKGVL